MNYFVHTWVVRCIHLHINTDVLYVKFTGKFDQVAAGNSLEV